MGWGGGGDSPPDYSEELGEERDKLIAGNETTANVWNKRAGAYNDAVTDATKAFQGFQKQIGNPDQLTIANLWDDPNTRKNENVFQYLDGLEGLKRRLDNPLFGGSRTPVWQTYKEDRNGDGDFGTYRRAVKGKPQALGDAPELTFSTDSEYGKVSVGSNKPQLVDANRTGYSKLTEDIGGLIDLLTGLQKQRGTEVDRIRTAATGWTDSAEDALRGLGRMSFKDQDALTNWYDTTWDPLADARKNFSSTILGQLERNPWSRTDALFNKVENVYGGKLDAFGEHKGEDRTAAQTFLGDIRGLLGEARGLDALDSRGFNRLTRRYENFSDRLTGWGDDYGTDLGKHQELLGRIDTILDAAGGKRTAADTKADTSLAALLGDADSLSTDSKSLSRYDGATLGELRETYDDIVARRDGFTASPIDGAPDWTELNRALEKALGRITETQGLYDEGFSDIGADYGEITGLRGTDFWNTDALGDFDDKIEALIGRADLYSGSGAEDLMAQLTGDRTWIDDQYGLLDDKRGSIEEAAKALLDGADNEGFLKDLPTVDAQKALLDAILGDVDQYGGTMADDEVATIQALLSGARNRIETDTQALASRQRLERERIEKSLAGQLAPGTSVDPFARTQAAGGTSGRKTSSEEELLVSLFSRGLGL